MLKQRKRWRLLFIMLFMFGGLSLGYADGLPLTFATELSGEQVIPPVATDASGSLSAVLLGDQLFVTGTYADLSSSIFGHGDFRQSGIQIHLASVGENGNIVRADVEQLYPGLRTFRLFHDGGSTGSFMGIYKLSEMQVQDLADGLYYLSIVTEARGRIELRGQLLPTLKLELDAKDLTGLWEIQAAVDPDYLQFNEDGSYSIFETAKREYVLESGLYTLDGLNFTFTTEADNFYCPNAKGVYTVMLSEHGQLRFFPLEDACSIRLSNLRGSLILPMTQ